ncbi:MAG: RusA family crossover junction endodeoxyribonuclease [Paraclostridium bifermentans]|uniref:RusA family crossover junction endodeoxyribonuclease n=1 Tax=Paraclostridium bifermentans TaxID=1490 RepID=UPI0024202EC8|nr:RusA family crossover junction endodeoxyribonuclease [Paraclostridium bifermentans]MBS5952560.1 RusA family crossover junction endodeoxyribonuclease [Paraclostridium bifermentans]
MKVNFTIDGEAKGKERPKFSTQNGRAFTPEQTKHYENWVKLLYRTTVKHYFEGNVKMSIVCYYGITKKDINAIAKNNIKTKEFKEARAKLDGVIRPTKKPDLDNVIKAIADSLNGIAYKDDAQIVEVVSKKFYSERPRVEVTIEDLD